MIIRSLFLGLGHFIISVKNNGLLQPLTNLKTVVKGIKEPPTDRLLYQELSSPCHCVSVMLAYPYVSVSVSRIRVVLYNTHYSLTDTGFLRSV